MDLKDKLSRLAVLTVSSNDSINIVFNLFMLA